MYLKKSKKMKKNSVIQKLLKETSLETRFYISIEMTFIKMLGELGFIENRPWDEDNVEDTKILSKIIETAKNESKYLITELKKWEKDGRPE
jgi:uncharacterized membrane protein (UPF0127 family)